MYFIFCIFCVFCVRVFSFFFCKGHCKSLSEPGVSYSESMSLVLYYTVSLFLNKINNNNNDDHDVCIKSVAMVMFFLSYLHPLPSESYILTIGCAY